MISFHMTNDRAAAEEEYSKKLLKVAKMPLGSKECGTLKNSLVAVKTELETMGNAHAEVAANMRRELEDALGNMAASTKEIRKMVASIYLVFLMQTMANIEKLRRTKQAQEHALSKVTGSFAHNAYFQFKEKYEADCIKVNGYIAQQNMLLGKELEKVEPTGLG